MRHRVVCMEMFRVDMLFSPDHINHSSLHAQTRSSNAKFSRGRCPKYVCVPFMHLPTLHGRSVHGSLKTHMKYVQCVLPPPSHTAHKRFHQPRIEGT